MSQCNNIFFTCFASSQIRGDWSLQVFFAQMTSCAMCYDVIYNPFANSQYLKLWGIDSLDIFSDLFLLIL